MSQVDHIARLRAARPRDRFVRLTLLAFACMLVGVWFTGEFALAEFDWDRRMANCQRFFGQVLPFPVQQATEASFTEKLGLAGRWFSDLWQEQGAEAFRYTLGLSVVAIVLLLTWLPPRRYNVSGRIELSYRPLHHTVNLFFHKRIFVVVGN